VIAVSQAIQDVLDVHEVWAWVTISANGIAGVIGLVIWRRWEWRGRWYWWVTGVAEVTMLIQILLGVIVVSDDAIVAPRFHMFYGFVAFVTIGLVYSYRAQMRGREELLYGLAGLFIMGLGLRAWLQVR
jgi:hypothetical protein